MKGYITKTPKMNSSFKLETDLPPAIRTRKTKTSTKHTVDGRNPKQPHSHGMYVHNGKFTISTG